MTRDISFFDDRAETWNEDNPVPRHKLIRMLNLCDLNPGQKILDVGTGAGRLIPLLLEYVGPEGRVCGLDPSEGMLSVARRRHSAANLSFVHCAAESIPLEDSSFHRVICYAVFPHFEDRDVALNQLVRVLKPRGVLAIAHTESRHTINSHHQSAGSQVADDILPPAAEVAGLMRRQQLQVNRCIDCSDFFFVSGTKGATAG
ncbi:MAG: methyltransferase domain-containing protein [Bacillota bacterium]